MEQAVILKKGKEIIFTTRHPWIFSGAIEKFPVNFQNGHIYPVFSKEGKQLGSGYFHGGISLCGRILSWGSADPYKAIQGHIDAAISLRDSLFQNSSTTMYRLINGEGDSLPGLIIDYYEGHLVLQSGTLGMDLLKGFITEYLKSKNRYLAIYEKSTSSSRKEEKLKDHVTIHYGEDKEEIIVKENGLQFVIDWKKGQKTGFFIDQREMRKKVGEMAKNRKVLNAFSYSGGFSLYALEGGAKEVHSVDISPSAIDLALKNSILNGQDQTKHHLFVEDVFTFLDEKPLDYDFVILDPPAFAKKKGDVKRASRGYYQINFKAFQKMPKGSLLLTCSCSYHIPEDLFLSLIRKAAQDAKREVRIISKHILAPDHPINIYHAESDYLKSFLLYIL